MSGITLGELARELAAEGLATDSVDEAHGSLMIADVHFESSAVTPGTLFCCLPGRLADGHDFADLAVAAGAVALLCERALPIDVPQIVTGSTRAAMATAAAIVHGRPASKLSTIGVTGTNGKTTTVGLLASILESAGRRTQVIGTLTGARTTPEGPDLQRQLARAVHDGAEAVVMEVSSHGIVQQRIDGMQFDIAVFTNLSPDHLDFHGSMAEYFRAKAKLFEPHHARRAVVNLDDPHGLLLNDAALIPTTGFTRRTAEPIEADWRGSTFTHAGRRVRLPLAGEFNVLNALAAATTAGLLGVDDQAIAEGLEAAPTIAGRFQVIDEGQPFGVIVDFAHTPDGLQNCLEAARALVGGGRVFVVFGAGGNRDRAKRPLMGAIAERLADVVVVADDNPRDELPGTITDEIVAGMTDRDAVTVIHDRREAIATMISTATEGDVVVIAGKGHEQMQTIGTKVTAFDDRVVASEALRSAGWGR